jgi:outer membrane receptor protein involved in Fe transport
MAQSANATLHGQVTGGSGTTEITAKNVATGAVRRTQASSDGTYTLVGLPPGTYEVEAGSGPTQTVQLSVASTATLDLLASAAAPAEIGTVTVTGVALPDVKKSEVGKTISLHQIETTPQVSRNFLEFADTVPGMVFTVDQNGHTSLRGGGQNNSSTNVYIDGVGQKSYVKEGGVSGQFATQGNPFPQLAIGEYKVITSNYKAEYGQISSAAVTAVTKSGTNEFHGEAYMRYTDNDMRARTPAELAAGEKDDESANKEYGFAVGGPIIQDRMHFFLTYEAKRFDVPTNVFSSVSGLPSGLLPPDVESQFGPTSNPFKEDLFFGKIDWEVTDDDRIEFSGQVRNEHQQDNVGDQNAVSHGIDVINKDKRFTLRWEHSAANWFNELVFTHEDAYHAPTPLNFGNGAIYTFSPHNNDTLIAVGPADPRAAQDKGQKGPAIEDNLTFNDFSWHGDHVIKMGLKIKDITLHAQDALEINPQFYYDVTLAGTNPTPYKAFFNKGVSGLGTLAPSVESKDRQIGWYVQDDWAVNDKLTLNIGLRWDIEKNPSYLDFVTPANVVAALNAPNPDPNAPSGQTYAQALALGGIDINDYISTGNNRKAYKNEWQPRFGFSYDIDGDEKRVIHGGAGRAYDRDLYDYLQLEVTKTALPGFEVYFRDPVTDLCRGNPCFDWDPNFLNGLENLQALVAAGNGGEVDMINNNLKVPYSDQFSIGMSNRIGDWQTDVTIARILSYDGFAFTLGNRYPNGDFFENGGQPWGNGVPGFGNLIVGNNGIKTRTTQLLVSADKAYTKASGWGASFAYTYTEGKQNRDIDQHYSFDEATIGDYPFLTSNAAPRHRLVATGSYDIPWGITLGAKLTLATGVPRNDFVCQPPTQPVGMGFCVPADASPIGNGRFLFGGQVFAYRSIDLQATKDFRISDDVSVFARLDLLNALNFRNYTSVLLSTVNGQLVPVGYDRNGGFTGVPRTLKFELGVRF